MVTMEGLQLLTMQEVITMGVMGRGRVDGKDTGKKKGLRNERPVYWKDHLYILFLILP